MAEPIVIQIEDLIVAAIDGQQDPDSTFTLRAVQPKILDLDDLEFQHADVIISIGPIETISKTTVESRTEMATFLLHGIILELPAGISADTILSRMAKTIQSLMLAENETGQTFDGLAVNIDCPNVDFGTVPGGVSAEVTVQVMYQTALADGYAGPN